MTGGGNEVEAREETRIGPEWLSVLDSAHICQHHLTVLPSSHHFVHYEYAFEIMEDIFVLQHDCISGYNAIGSVQDQANK